MANLRTAHTCLYKSFFLIDSIQALPNSSHNKVVGHMDFFSVVFKRKFLLFTFSQQFSHFRENMCNKRSNARSIFKQCCFSKILIILAKIVDKICTEIYTTRQFSENLVKYMKFFTFSRQKKIASSFHPYASF